MVTIHVIIALVSMAYATILLMRPAKTSFGAHYTLIAATITTGTYLLISSPAHMLETCTMGLLYSGFVGVATIFAHNKLAAQNSQHEDN